MEKEAPSPHDKITTISDEENLIMLVPAATHNPPNTEPHKQQVGQGVDDLGRINCRIVILDSAMDMSQ